MLTDERIKVLLKGCEGVTSGTWKTHIVDGTYVINDELEGICRTYDEDIDDDLERYEIDAAHIARCDPGTIAEMCTRLLSAEARVEVLEDALNALVDEYCDYAIINHLGDPERQHNIKRARTALQEQSK